MAVTAYMPNSKPNSIQLKPRPQRKTIAATRPRKGKIMATRLAARSPNDSRRGVCGSDAVSTTGGETRTGVKSVIRVFLAWSQARDFGQTEPNLERRRYRTPGDTHWNDVMRAVQPSLQQLG